MADSYSIKTEVFEGPLDLLLSLIEKRKLLINDISLAKIADDYMEYVKSLSSLPVCDTANFLLVASTLVLIKSKSLLPSMTLSEEEEGNIRDLEERLRVYKIIRQASVGIGKRYGQSIIFTKSQAKNFEVIFSPDSHTTIQNIYSGIKNVLNSLPKKERMPETVVKKVMSLEEMIDKLKDRIQTHIKTGFKEFSGMGKSEKAHIVVSFLAMLELVKRGIIDVAQEKKFGDINIESRSIGVPKYQ